MSYERCQRCLRFFENIHHPRPVRWWEIRMGLVQHPLKEEAVIQIQLCEECVNGAIEYMNQYLGYDMLVQSISSRMSKEQVKEMDERNQKIRVKVMASGVYDMNPEMGEGIANMIENRDVDKVMEILGYDPMVRFPNAYTQEEIDTRNKNIRERQRRYGVYVSPKMDDVSQYNVEVQEEAA